MCTGSPELPDDNSLNKNLKKNSWSVNFRGSEKKDENISFQSDYVKSNALLTVYHKIGHEIRYNPGSSTCEERKSCSKKCSLTLIQI